MRHAVSLLLPLFFLLVLPTVGHARSGAYRGPGGSVPPGLREPSDPAPPPPPPPHAPRVGPQPTTPERPVMRATPSMPLSFEAWFFWYENNRDLLEAPPIVEVIRSAETEKDAGPGAAKAAILAATTADDGAHPSVRGAALIALGKTADQRSHVNVLVEALSADGPRRQIARESAALGLGLLRRNAEHLQFDAATYDRARDALLDVVESDAGPARLRGFAALGLGLLGDQSTAKPPREVTTRLFAVLDSRPPNVDVSIGVLGALRLQPRASFTPIQIETLRTLAYQGSIEELKVPDLLRCHALSALSLQGTEADITHMDLLLAGKRGISANVYRSAVISLGVLGRDLSQEARLRILDILAMAATHQRDTTTRLFALTAMIPVFQYPLEMRTALVQESAASDLLIATAAYGDRLERPYAALALGRMLQDEAPLGDGETSPFAAKARRVLRRGVEEALAPSTRAAFALALGITGDPSSKAPLHDIAADRESDSVLRAYALLGLSYLARATPGAGDEAVLRDLDEGLAQRRNPFHRLIAVRAMGMAGCGRVDALASAFASAKSATHKGEAAAALARMGTAEARDALVQIATDPEQPAIDRGLAIAALGRLLDPQSYAPSLARLTMFLNYRASTDLIQEILSLL